MTMLPPMSLTADHRLGGEGATPSVAPPPGWVVKTSWVATPALMVKALDVVVGEPGGSGGQRVGPGLAGDLAAGEGGYASAAAFGLVVQVRVPPATGRVPRWPG